MSEQSETNSIRIRAYFIWEREGRPEGRAVEHWLLAAAAHSVEIATTAPNMKKLDPELQLLIQRQNGTLHPLVVAALVNLPSAEEVVRVTIEFGGDPRDLEAVGFVRHSLIAHPAKGYKIATGTIPASRLEALARIDHLVLISAPHPIHPLLNYSAEEIRAAAVHQRNPGGATGRGVVVGIIDSGVEVRHGVFYDDNLQSQIIAIWDQKSSANQQTLTSLTQTAGVATATTPLAHGYTTGDLVTIAGAAPSGYNGVVSITVTGSTAFTYSVSAGLASPATGTITVGKARNDGVVGKGGLGRIYDRAAINTALQNKQKLETNDKIGHGTMVAGVAAGDGSPATCCVGHDTYIGIAPAAEIIAVGLNLSGALGDSQHAIDAVDFIFTHPDTFTQPGNAPKPLAVNISLGVMRGAHDGSSPFEKAINSHIASRANSAVIVAAGNFANKKWHTKGTIAANQTFDVKFNVVNNDVRSRFLEVWYRGGAGLNVKLIAPGNTALAPVNGTYSNGVLPADQGPFVLSAQAGGAPIMVTSVTVVPDNHDNRI